LKPEHLTEWEAGLGGATLGGRLSVGFTWYQQTTTDALVTVRDLSDPPQERMDRLENVGKVRNRGIELEINGALVNMRDWGLDAGLELTTNHSKLLDLGGVMFFRGLNDWLLEGHPVPVGQGVKVADPDAVNGPWSRGRYVLEEDGDPALVVRGPQLPTHMVASTLSLRVPWGGTLSARGEYRGGNVRRVSPDGGRLSSRSPLCIPYLVDPESVLDYGAAQLKPDTPDLWQERCTSGQDFWFDADYFKLRSVYATLPVGFAFPESVDEATLTVSLANAWTWHREVPWWDLEILADDGANDDGLGTAERVPAPTTLTFGLRVRF
jgi:outer membrane receptor protein involved in Fe transport